MIELNRIYNEDCLEGMKRIPDGFVDLTVTSPPYDNLRTYNGNIEQWSFEKFQGTAKELYRVTKQGGVVVWVVGDATINGSETGTSFRQALFFMECGFNLHDTMIWKKTNPIPLTHNRYEQHFEYMFVFSKGSPKTFNPIKIPCATKGQIRNRKNSNKEEGSAVRNRNEVTVTKSEKIKGNVWEMPVSNTKYNHPAIFPEQLAQDHILSWSNAGDTVLDPFIGSGTTAIACINTGRNFIGFELDKHYCDIANERIQKALADSTRKEYDE
jgi:site-specific DNA-methyltransferase (adenine-specific)